VLRARTRTAVLLLGLAGLGVLLAGTWLAGRTPAASRTVVGRIVVAHQDGAVPGRSRVRVLLETSHGPVELRLPQGVSVVPGTRVALRNPRYEHGTIVEGDLARLGPPTAPVGNPNIGPANFTTGARKVLVLLMQVQGQAAPGGADAVRNIIFTAPNSANAFVQQETFGQSSLTGKLRADGDIYGPYTVPMAPNICDPVGWGTNAEGQFQKKTGFDPETWDNVIILFQASYSLCPFSGEGEIGQLYAGTQHARHVWINGVLSNGVPTTSVVAHELGHNFGVDHAGGLTCFAGGPGSARIAFSESCATSEAASSNGDEYADPFDVMGNGAREESAYHRWESGWLPSSAVQTASSSGTYLIAPVETATSALQLLEVPRGSGQGSYWLDFRQPLAGWFDDFSPGDPAVNGVAVRYANASYQVHPAKSWLLDTTPATSTFTDAPLGVGRSYGDALRGVTISTLSVSALGALVKVTLPGPADTSPPSVPGGFSAAVVGGQLNLSWAASSDDSGLVQHYLVTRAGAPLADVYGTSTSDPAPSAGPTEYDVSAVDPAGNQSAPARLQVTLTDGAPPTAPVGLAASVSGSTVQLEWSPATDNLGVASYEVDRDGLPIATGLQATALSDPGVALGTHTYSVRAFDAAGNAGAYAQVTVVLVGPAAIVPTPKARVKTVTALKLRRLGKHRVLVSWKALTGARRYQVLRAGKPGKLLATIKKVQYLDGHAPTGKLAKSRYVVRAVLD
jgi:hypothetical protein